MSLSHKVESYCSILRIELNPTECRKKVKTDVRYTFGGSFIVLMRLNFKVLSECKNILSKLLFAFLYEKYLK